MCWFFSYTFTHFSRIYISLLNHLPSLSFERKRQSKVHHWETSGQALVRSINFRILHHWIWLPMKIFSVPGQLMEIRSTRSFLVKHRLLAHLSVKQAGAYEISRKSQWPGRESSKAFSRICSAEFTCSIFHLHLGTVSRCHGLGFKTQRVDPGECLSLQNSPLMLWN